MLAPISFTIEVPCPQAQAFDIFIRDMGSWWPLDKRAMSKMAGSAAKELRVDPTQGGKIVEFGEDGSEHHWATITEYDPHDALAMAFHMGLPADKAGRVAVTFTPLTDDRTRVVLTHSDWEAYGDMAEMMINGYGSSWPMIFEECYKAACDNG